ncbi:ATP-binding mismatch repair protein [Rhodotorula paludigena]|uniref:ATP-binding mismatch repair protein n=1 Tax=Rhodotorula paludigena TaxID=86838 RepID=UPI003175546E
MSIQGAAYASSAPVLHADLVASPPSRMHATAIDRTSVHRLTSGQVVIDLQTAVKELVENALDAGATSIEVAFREHGTESLEVKDNGKGIDQSDWEGIALKHHTSKLSSFSDLASVSTLGFRGEALSSLCGVATLSMVTSTAATAPMGTTLAFSHAGECLPAGKVARMKGTTVKVDRLFDALPVRRKELVKNAKREFGKALDLLQAYAVINSGVRIEVKNVTKGKPTLHLKTTASTSLRTSFSHVFAPKSLASLLDLDLSLEVATERSVLKRVEGAADASTTVKVLGLISKPVNGHGRTASNRQFYYINGRPFQPSKIAKAVNEVYKQYNANQFPTIVADFQLSTDAYDVNVSPDKRTIFLHSEGNLITALKEQLVRFFEPETGRFAMQAIGPARQDKTQDDSQVAEDLSAAGLGDELPDELDERPRKRRKSSPALADEFAANSPSMDVDNAPNASGSPVVDHATHSNTTNVKTAFYELPDDEIVLPTPPSPFRNGSAALDVDGTGAVALSDHLPDTPADRSPTRSPTAPPRKEDDTPLFREHSPTPQNRLPSAPSARTDTAAPSSPSPPPPASTARQPLLPAKLIQPTLSFGAPPHTGGSTAKASRDATAAAKVRGRSGAKEPQKAMRSHLSRFLRGTQGDEDAESANDESLAADDGETGDIETAEEATEGEPANEEDEVEPDEPEDEVMIVDDAALGAGGDMVVTGTDAPEDEEKDAVIVVENGFPEFNATQPESHDVVAASCACVHGSQQNGDDDGEDSELEIVEPTPSPPSRPMSHITTASGPSTSLPFGAAPAEVAGTVVAADVTVPFDFCALAREWAVPPEPEAGPSRTRSLGRSNAEDELAGAGVGEEDQDAEATLSRVVAKDDFAAMQVVGQFNLGFIIARRRVRAGSAKGKEREVNPDAELHDDLFIVDQHASDEKYNFERLQAETVIQSQRLLAPRTLNLPSADEIIAMDNLDLLRLNGYNVLIDEDADVGERVKLVAQPVSKDTVFDVGDFEELVDLIGTRSGGEVVRPSKARRMFASRACRKSVMIGKALNAKQMTTILRHMGGMDQPWACPHGRPTMRWLASLDTSSPCDPRSDLAQLLTAYDDA